MIPRLLQLTKWCCYRYFSRISYFHFYRNSYRLQFNITCCNSASFANRRNCRKFCHLCRAISIFTVTLTGTAPWEFHLLTEQLRLLFQESSSPHTITVSPAVTSTYTLSAARMPIVMPLRLTGSAVITVLPLPTATLSGNTTICIGSSANLSVALTGAQPWSVTYTDGTTPVTVSGITSPYTTGCHPLQLLHIH